MTEAAMPTNVIEALARVTAEMPCREWRGARDRHGYGRIFRMGRVWYVHRWVWTLANGPIPSGIKILHRCDNPPCFRLDHLFDGTQADNMADMAAKGRATNRNASKTHCDAGHPLEGDNLYEHDGHRRCKICQRARHSTWKARRRTHA